MHPDLEKFLFCPACAARELSSPDDKSIVCGGCGFRYFHNCASAVAVVLQLGDEILLARRARDPGKGLLDLPGGFVDPGETLEEAARRELIEELGLQIATDQFAYAFSCPNRYRYGDVTYRTTDVVLTAALSARPTLRCADDVASAEWVHPATVDPSEAAFPVLKELLSRLTA